MFGTKTAGLAVSMYDIVNKHLVQLIHSFMNDFCEESWEKELGSAPMGMSVGVGVGCHADI